MKNARSIAGLMWNDHERIMEIFNDFKSTKDRDRKKATELFNRFHSDLMKHIEVEEKVINLVLKKTNGRENLLPIANSIVKEHDKIREMLQRIFDSVKEGSKGNVSDFFLTLRHHKNIEDRLFYPRLDEVLSEKEKLHVIERIKT